MMGDADIMKAATRGGGGVSLVNSPRGWRMVFYSLADLLSIKYNYNEWVDVN